MSADIEKLAVFDGRIVQSRPKYAVEKGALSLTNAPFNAIAATSGQHTYNIYVPSENVYVDRALEWSSTVFQQFSVRCSETVTVPGQAIVKLGRDIALRSFPLNALCSTLTATINDTTSVINTQDVLDPVLRLADYRKNRLQRTCPTMLDKYASYDECPGAVNNPLAGWENTTVVGEAPNGAWGDLVFTDPAGNPLVGSASPAYAGATYNTINGVPVFSPSQGYLDSYQIYVRWRSTEKLVLSPFVFADTHEWDTGLFGINNIQLIMNLRESSRTLRSTTAYARFVSNIGYNTGAPGGTGFSSSVVNALFLTPSLDVPLPPKSVVPYMEFPRYITQASAQQVIAPGQVGQIQSQTITLPQIPDLFIIYVKPSAGVSVGQSVNDPNCADFYLPVATGMDGVRNPLNINFDNFSGLLSSTTPEQLYAMSVKNGLEMDYDQWAGMAQLGFSSSNVGTGAGRTALSGGFLVLKPSQDITLQSGQAPSLVGNFTFQFNLQIKNNTANPQQPSLYVITANSGFFESIRGSSRIIKGVLSEQDIISAPVAPQGTRDSLARVVGGRFNFANMLSKAKDFYHMTKPAVSALKGALPGEGMAGKVKEALGAVGYGQSGGRMSRRMM